MAGPLVEPIEQNLSDLVVQATTGEVGRNARPALVEATMASARMILSKAYLLPATASY